MTQRGRDAKGRVYLVGAGPGDPGLLTCRGLECLQMAEVLIYDGLAPIELLAHTPQGCEHIYAGKKHSPHGPPISQDDINALLVNRARAGRVVVRLKGGDPFVFGRGTEECLALARAGLDFEVVPGVSAATAVAAYAGIPLTARGVAASAVLVTGHEAAGKNSGGVDWQAVAGHQSIVLFMAWKHIDSCVSKLLESGKASTTPAAAIRWGTRAGQLTVRTTLGELPEVMRDESMRPPVLVIVGAVVSVSEQLAWFERRPLFGKRVLLTREPQRAEAINRGMRDLGAGVLVAPTTRIKLASAVELKSLGDTIVSGNWDWLMLSSANAVLALRQALDAQEVDCRVLANVKIAAVGRATQTALAEMGLRPDLVPTTGSGIGLADAVRGALASPKAARILYPRARHGREEAVEELERAGCDVEVVNAYESVARAGTEPALADALSKLRGGMLDAVAFFAPSQLHSLCEMAEDVTELLAKVPVLAAIGPTTAEALRAKGLTPHAVSKSPDAEDMTQAIADAFLALPTA